MSTYTFNKPVIVDGRGHLVGRLASVIAKQLLNGQKVVVVRCEELNISGALYRNKEIYHIFLRKHMNTNPRRGPIHYRAPARIFWRTVRGMLPHKTERGAAALARLKIFEGVPHPYDKKKRVVVPSALRNLRLKPGRKFTRLGDLSTEVGWKHDSLIQRLEKKRKVLGAAYHKKKNAVVNLRNKAVKNAGEKLAGLAAELKKFGHTL